MKKFVLALPIFIFAFVISACVQATYGPSDDTADAEYVRCVKAALDKGEAIKFMDKAYMLANTEKPGPAQTWGAFGTLVVSDENLYFLFWNRKSNAFDTLRKLPVADMVNVKHISSPFGPGDYVSIEDKNRRFDLFSCYEANSSASMIERNAALLAYLNKVINAK